MDESGNILLKRLGKSPVYVKVKMLTLMIHTVMNKELTIDLKNNLGKLEIITLTFQNTPEDSAVSNDLLKLNNGLVDIEKVRVLNNKKHKKSCRLQICIDDFFFSRFEFST